MKRKINLFICGGKNMSVTSAKKYKKVMATQEYV